MRQTKRWKPTEAIVNRRLLAGGPVRATAVLAVVAGCGGAQGEPPEQDGEVGEAYRRVVNVEVERVEPRAFTRTIRLTGVAVAMRDVVVSAEEAGLVRQISVDKGSRVRAGSAILRLDETILKAQVQAAAAQAEYDEEVWERRKKLYEEDGVGSELAYHEARHAAEQSRGNLDVLEARLARTTIRAPIGGVLDSRLVEIGTLVSPGTPVVRIVQADTIRILAGIPERYALYVSAGTEASVSFDVLPGEAHTGSTTFVGVTVDQDTRTFPIELTLTNPGGHIKPGMVADVSVAQAQLPDAIVVPRQALVSMEEGHVVFVVEGAGEESLAVVRPVGIVTSQGNDVVVETGLRAGDRLVVVGQQGLTDGDRVRVVAGAAGEPGGES